MDAAEEETSPAECFRFSVRSLLWVTALLSAGMGTFGTGLGTILSVAVLAAHSARQKEVARVRLSVVVGLLAALVALLWPVLPAARAAARHNASVNNLRRLLLAIHNFADSTGHLPPPYSTDGRGEPLHSWRTLILPYVSGAATYKKLRLEEPWDSCSNSVVFDTVGDGGGAFRSPQGGNAAEGMTHYVAVVDDETVWSPSQAVRFRDNLDGTSQTIALIEVAGRGLRWSEPRDLTLEEAISILVGEMEEEYVQPGFFVSRRVRGDGLPDRGVAFVDGHVQTMAPLLRREDARALLTRAGGEIANPFKNLPTRSVDSVTVGYIVHWGRVFGLTLFAVLAIAPLLENRRSNR